MNGSYRSVLAMLLAPLAAVLGVLAFASAPAQALIVHKYLSTPHITEVPESTPIPYATSPGHLTEVQSMTVDEGHVWTDERVIGTIQEHRMDEFSDSTGAFVLQLSHPAEFNASGIAVAHAGGETQVLVGTGSTVSVFDGSTGAPVGEWEGKGVAGIEKFGGVSAIAVDPSRAPGDWAAGDVYVADAGENVVDVFKPMAGGGEEYVTRLPGTFTHPEYVAVSASTGEVFVADRTEAVAPGEYAYVIDAFEPEQGLVGVYKERTITEERNTRGESLGSIKNIRGLAVNGPENGLFLDQPTQGEESAVSEFSLTGVLLGRVTGTLAGNFHRVESIAVDQSSGELFVNDANSKTNTGVIDAFGPGEVAPDVLNGPVSGERLDGKGAIEVTLNGEVDPLGAGAASCDFIWGSAGSLSNEASCSVKVANVSVFEPVHVTLTGLEPGTTYCYRLQAANATVANPGAGEECFTTEGPSGLTDEWSGDVRATSATLSASIDPRGSRTSYYFQYGKTGAYEEPAVPVAPGEAIGAGVNPVSVEQHLQGLAPSTTYHYRVVAVSEVGGIVETFAGPDRTFTTHPVGAPLVLPDGRAWELVSNVETRGTTYFSLSMPAAIRAAADGSGFTDLARVPTERDPAGYDEAEQVLFTRSGSGWSARDISPPRAFSASNAGGASNEFRLFSPDLSLGLVDPFGPFASLGEQSFPEATERTPYLRNDATCGPNGSPGCYTPLVTGAPGYSDVYEPATTKFGGNPKELVGEANVVGASEDLEHVAVSVEAGGPALTGTATPEGGLYEFSADKPPTERLQLVSLLPSAPGGPPVAASDPRLGVEFQGPNVARAVSTDGSRVIWTGSAGQAGRPHLYMRDTARGETVQLDAPTTGSITVKDDPIYQAASGDGSTVFFIDDAELIKGQSGVGGYDLYVCEMRVEAGRLKCDLSDLTPEVTEGQSANVEGMVLGASEEGSYVYFVAKGVLTSEANAAGEHATAGADNLYTIHRGADGFEGARLVAVLSPEDKFDWEETEESGHYTDTPELTARVSPDGRFLAFMSDRSLTGYDNHDAVSGAPDQEVFEYDAASGRVVCGSCMPSGARPVGVGGSAANIPGWTQENVFSGWYQSRYLSDSGRLFFNSLDALVAQDINGVQDVYEFEPSGVGDCTAGSVTFSAGSGGCIGLISSGTSALESSFLEASETGGRDAEGAEGGGDVFFLTAESLVPRDTGSGYDIYDAHECTSASPCVASVAVPGECVTADSCRSAPEPQPGVFGAPPSATFSGAGNLTPPAPVVMTAKKATKKAVRCKQGFVKNKHGKCVKKKKAKKAKRAGNDRRGRR